MKKHMRSIQSTKDCDISTITYEYPQQKFSYSQSINKLFTKFCQFLKMRSYLLYRDIQQIYQICQTFLEKTLNIQKAQELWKFITLKNQQDKIYQKEQISFFVKMVLQLDNQRKQAAQQGKMKLFQLLKTSIQLIQSKTAEYQKLIRNKKYFDKFQNNLKEKQQRSANFQNFQRYVKQNLQYQQTSLRNTFQQQAYAQTINTEKQLNKSLSKFAYKVKPSKFLAEAKDLSLKAKLSPYASQLKRSYDYKSIEAKLSKTIDLEMNRKLSLISHLKQVEIQKVNRSHQKRYSVLQDRLNATKNRVQKQLQQKKQQLEYSQMIREQEMNNRKVKKQQSRVFSLQKSFNALNMHSDTLQIKKILHHHKNSTQFSNQILDVANLSSFVNDSLIKQPYGTLTANMNKDVYMNNAKKRDRLHQKRILRRFQRENGESDQEADDICGSNIKHQFNREKSLVALYDNQLKPLK